MTLFGVRPDSNSPIARKIEAFVRAREEQRRAPVVSALHGRAKKAFLCERFMNNRGRAALTAIKHMRRYFIRVRALRSRSLRGILRDIHEKYGFNQDVLESSLQARRIVLARTEYFYRAAAETGYSFKIIGRLIWKERSTVKNGIRRYAQTYGLPMPRDMVTGPKKFGRDLEGRKITP